MVPDRRAPSPQDSTPMPPSGDAQLLRPLLPSADEGNTTGGKDPDGCPQPRSCTARKPRVLAAGALRTAGHGSPCRSGRPRTGAGVSASGGPAQYEIRVAGVLDGLWADWFDGLQISGRVEETVICGLVADQSALLHAAPPRSGRRCVPARARRRSGRRELRLAGAAAWGRSAHPRIRRSSSQQISGQHPLGQVLCTASTK